MQAYGTSGMAGPRSPAPCYASAGIVSAAGAGCSCSAA